MNAQFQKQAQHKQDQQVQSFYEPTLYVLTELFERNKSNLRSKGYDQNNVAITRQELMETIAYRFRITQWLASQIITSLINANKIQSFGGYLKPLEDI